MEQIFYPSRVPPVFGGIQVNFCKTPGCPNFGRPAAVKARTRWRPRKGSAPHDGYNPIGDPARFPLLKCEHCKISFPLKSNRGIKEELVRLSGHRREPTEGYPSERNWRPYRFQPSGPVSQRLFLRARRPCAARSSRAASPAQAGLLPPKGTIAPLLPISSLPPNIKKIRAH
jgi:hypothetical protein